jgi:4-amino-4-deoxy-L-arabinose transferase-like glycosyltransferase
VFPLLIAGVSAVNIARSIRQSLTIDEAMSFLSFSSKPLAEMFVYYDANNHVLFTLLSRVCYLLLGNAEWAIRLPSVLGGIAFLCLLALVLRRLLGEGWTALAAWLAIVSNPLLLDHLSAGRGYGLAMAFWLGAALVLFDGLGAGGWRHWWGAGALLGLAIAANLNLLLPGAALGLSFLCFRGRDWAKAAAGLAAGALLVAAPLLYPALRHATRDNFYYGANAWDETLDQFVWQTLMPVHGGFDLAVALPNLKLAVPLFLLVVAFGVPLLWRRREALFLAMPALLLFGFYAATHRFAEVKLPLGRTALPLFAACLLAAAAVAQLPYVRYAMVPVFLLVTGTHLAASRWEYYGEWPDDAENRVLAAVARQKPGKICSTWTLVPSLNYYRLRYGLQSPELVFNERGPECVWFYATADDQQWPREQGFREVAAGSQSKVKVYRNPAR